MSPETAHASTPSQALTRVGAWLARNRATILTILILGIAFAASLYPVQRDQPQYAPDTRYYAAMALRFSGLSAEDAHALVAEHTARSGWETPPVDVLFGWGLVQPRVVYPALSVPFVKLFGIEGMVVVPVLAWAAFIGGSVWFIRNRYQSIGVLAVALLVIASPKLMFFATAMLTESLTALWCAAILVAVWRHQATGGRGWLAAAAGFTILMQFTRQAAIIPAAALAFAWVAAVVLRDRPRRWWQPALVVGAVTVVTQVIQTLAWPTFSQFTQYLHATESETLGEALRNTPGLIAHILKMDFRNYLTSDHALLTLIVLSMLAVVVLWRRAEAHLLIGAFLAISFLNITNGTPTTFRYALPGLVFYMLAVSALLERATPDGFGSIPGPDAWHGSNRAAGRREMVRTSSQPNDAAEQQRANTTPDEVSEQPAAPGTIRSEGDIAPLDVSDTGRNAEQ